MLKNDYLVAKIGVDTAENELWAAQDGDLLGESFVRGLAELPISEALRRSVAYEEALPRFYDTGGRHIGIGKF